ncbi:MAG: anti-sigma factor antagonist, partial [Anaerolineae bacterium]|nr:anti-sigma factor antagonist [Anaerolineae bacterium]
RLKAQLEQVRNACEFALHMADEAGFDARAAYHIEIAVDEACTNIVEHGFAGQETGQIDLIARFDDSCLTLIISDNSPPFDPTAMASVNMKNEVYKREPGGWGIHFVRQLMDEVHYGYSEGRNHLTLVKCLPMPPEPILETSDFKIAQSSTDKNYRVLQLAGRLDGVSSPMLLQTLNEQMQTGQTQLILDMAGVDYISSSGLKVLASGWRDCKEKGGHLVLVGLNDRLTDIFDIVGFNTFLDIYPDVKTFLAIE